MATDPQKLPSWMVQEREAQHQAEAEYWERYDKHMPREPERVDMETKLAEEEADRVRAEALRPDREKLEHIAGAVEAIVIPELSPGAEVAEMDVTRLLCDCAINIMEIAKGLP